MIEKYFILETFLFDCARFYFRDTNNITDNEII